MKDVKKVSVFNKNPCPLSAGIAVRFAQESLSVFVRNECPFWARICILGTKPPKAAIKQSLCNDMPNEKADAVVDNFTPESLAIYIQKIKYDLPDIPKLYIRLTNDAAFGIKIQDKMIKNLLPQTVVELNTGHLPMISKPNDLAKIINEFVSKVNI